VSTRGVGAAAAIALINSVGNTGGFVGPYLLGAINDATHRFTLGLYAIAILLACGSMLCWRSVMGTEGTEGTETDGTEDAETEGTEDAETEGTEDAETEGAEDTEKTLTRRSGGQGAAERFCTKR